MGGGGRRHDPTYEALGWIAPELIREGFLRAENGDLPEWVERAATLAANLYMTADLRQCAILMALGGPRAVDYLRQCPALAAAFYDGHWPMDKAERLERFAAWRAHVEAGAKLKTVMAAYGLPGPVRKISGRALGIQKWAALRCVAQAVAPSTLAQIIPAYGMEQGRWLFCVNEFGMRLQRDGYCWPGNAPVVAWAARTLAPMARRAGFDVHDASDVADYVLAAVDGSDPPYASDWHAGLDWDGAARRSAAWHAALPRRDTAEFKTAHGIGPDVAVDIHPLPLGLCVDGFEFIALNTGRMLAEEAAAMRHCVDLYARPVIAGACRIYGVRKDGARVATLEMTPHGAGSLRTWRQAQLKGKCNSRPAAKVWGACGAFEWMLRFNTGGRTWTRVSASAEAAPGSATGVNPQIAFFDDIDTLTDGGGGDGIA